MFGYIVFVVAITLVTARVYIGLLRSFISYRADKHLPAGVAAYFGWGLLSIPLLSALYHLIPGTWFALEVNLFAAAWNHVLFVGVVEELAKWTIFATVMHQTRGLRSPEDGIVMAAAVALAFATVENVVYAYNYGAWVLWHRSVNSVIGHMTYAAIWGYVWSSMTWDSGGAMNRDGLPLALAAVVSAGIVHGLFNTALYVSLALGILLHLVTLVLAVRAYRALRQHSPYRAFGWHEADLAVSQIRVALQRNPRSIVLRTRLGYYLVRLGRFREAERAFLSAKAKRSPDPALPFMAVLASAGWNGDAVGWREGHAAWAALPVDTRRTISRRLERLLAGNRPLRDRFRSFVNPTPPELRETRRTSRTELATARYLRRTRTERDRSLALMRMQPDRVDRKRSHLGGTIERTRRRVDRAAAAIESREE